MAIAGIRPVELTLFNKFGINVTADTHGVDLYTADQVRDILIKFASQHVLFGSGEPVPTVDEFMKDGE